jgi:hypothetical protein
MEHAMRIMLCSLAAVFALLARPASAGTDYTDLWWTPTEPGWGLNLAQQANAIFGTFYVYAVDGRSVWFTTQLARDGSSDRFSGPLYRIAGTFYGAPTWGGYEIVQAGAATFTATSSTTGTLDYSVDGVAVSKSIERLTLAPLSVAGVYVGGVSGRRFGCGPGADRIIDPMQFDVQHSTLTGDIRIDQISTVTFDLVCRMEGRATQLGKLLTVPNASYVCVEGWEAPARIYNLRPTAAGFEGQWVSDAGNGCSESGQFSGVTQFP